MKLHGWKQKCIALLLAGSMLYCGCHKAITMDEETTTSEEIPSQTEVLLESESESTSEESSETKETREPDLQIPEDALIDDLMNQFLTKNRGAPTIYMATNGRYKTNPNSALGSTKYLSSLYVEFLFSEDGYKYAKKSGETTLSLEEYRDMCKEMLPEYKSILDDDYHLKQMPVERILISFMQGLDLELVDEDTFKECIKEGFRLMITDPDIRSQIESTLSSDRITGDMVYDVMIGFSFNSDFDIDVTVLTMNYLTETKEAKTVVKFGKTIDNKVQGEAKITIDNAFQGQYNVSSVSLVERKEEAEVVLSKLEELRISSGTEEDAKPVDYPTLITIKFEDTYKTTYAYLGDGKWKYSSGYFNKTSLFTFAEEEKYMPLVDEIIAIASLPQIQNFRSIPDAFIADFSNTYDQSKMAKNLGKNYQAVTYYVKEDAYWGTILNGNKDEFIYYEGLTITSILKDGQTFFEHADEYEYGGVPGEMYFRPSMEDVFYEATKFDGHAGLDFLMNEISENGTFLYGFPVARGTETYNCEIFDMGKYRQGVLLDASGLPYAGWKWLEGDTHLGDNENETICKEGLALMESIAMAEIDPEIDEYLDHARTHIGKTGEDPITKTQTALEWIKEDQKEQGLPDLTANVTKGDIYPESQVVQEYIDFFISHEPFKIELWSFSNFTMDHEVLTIDGMDFYHSSIVRSHDNSFDYDFIYIALGDYVYQGGQEGLRKYPKDSYFTQKEVDLQLPEGLTPTASYMPKFMTAYDATIDGEKYIVEEWGNKDKTITYFCKDGKIVGFSFVDNGHKIVYHVVDFEKKADASLLVVPE